jgi:hypothetical protein
LCLNLYVFRQQTRRQKLLKQVFPEFNLLLIFFVLLWFVFLPLQMSTNRRGYGSRQDLKTTRWWEEFLKDADGLILVPFLSGDNTNILYLKHLWGSVNSR